MVVGGQRHARSLYPQKCPVPIIQKAGWATGLVLTGAENLAPTVIGLWTIQDVASRYTNWAIATQFVLDEFKRNKIRSHDLNYGSESQTM